MNSTRLSGFIATLALAGLHAGMALTGTALAQDDGGAIPANAVAKSYGGGWRCRPGYRESAGACDAIEIPENAYAEKGAYGSGWKCRHGFRESDGSCIAVTVPANAYLDPVSGDRWKCDRGFRALEDACVAVAVPAKEE